MVLFLMGCAGLVSPSVGHAGALVSGWTRIGGAAWDIGVGANGQAWVIGADPRPGGFGIYRRVNGDWANVPGGAARIDVDQQGYAWVVNSGGGIFKFDGLSGWLAMNGSATDVGVGPGGEVWIIGTTPQPGGFTIERYVPGYWKRTRSSVVWVPEVWQVVPGGAVRVDVGADGNPVVVNDGGAVFHWNGSGWDDLTGNLAGGASDVSVAADGTIWVLGRTADAFDFPIYQRRGGAWVAVPGLGRSIAAGDDVGRPWVTNSGAEIYRGSFGTTSMGLQHYSSGVCSGWSYYTVDPISETHNVNVFYGQSSPFYTVNYTFLGCRYATELPLEVDDWYEVSGCRVRVLSSGVLEAGYRNSNTTQFYGSDALMLNNCGGTTRGNMCPPGTSCASI